MLWRRERSVACPLDGDAVTVGRVVVARRTFGVIAFRAGTVTVLERDPPPCAPRGPPLGLRLGGTEEACVDRPAREKGLDHGLRLRAEGSVRDRPGQQAFGEDEVAGTSLRS